MNLVELITRSETRGRMAAVLERGCRQPRQPLTPSISFDADLRRAPPSQDRLLERRHIQARFGPRAPLFEISTLHLAQTTAAETPDVHFIFPDRLNNMSPTRRATALCGQNRRASRGTVRKADSVRFRVTFFAPYG